MTILLANAVIKFATPGASTGVDPETGNPIWLNSEIIIQASLNPIAPGKTPASTQKEIPGVNPTDVFLTGRAINPQVLPVSLLRGGKGTIELTDPASGNKIKGEFLMLATVPSKYTLATQLLGYRFEGYMQNVRAA
jgi:hypothetical protein